MLIRSHSDDKIKLAMQIILRDESFRDGYDSFDFDRFRNVFLVSSQKSMNEIIEKQKRLSNSRLSNSTLGHQSTLLLHPTLSMGSNGSLGMLSQRK